MPRKLPFLLFALLIACTPAPTPQEQVQANLDALPELAADIAGRIDTARMALRAPEPGPLPVDTGLMPDAAHAPCCSSALTKRLKVLYETTWCRDPLADNLVGDLPVAMARSTTGDTTGVRHSKFTSLRGRQLEHPFWCRTSSGPWDAELLRNAGCSGAAIFTLSISTPGGLVTLPSWIGGEQFKPAEVTVLECTVLSETRFRCSGLSTCNCISTACQQDCDCPLF